MNSLYQAARNACARLLLFYRSLPRWMHLHRHVRPVLRHTGRACVHGAKGCHHSFNAILCALALLQALLITMAKLGLEVPVPGPVQRYIISRFDAQGLKLEVKSLNFDLTGGIHASGLAVSDGNSQLLASASQLHFRMPMGEREWGGGRTGWVELEDLRLLVPASVSPEGVQQEIISQLFLNARLSRRGLNVNYAQFMLDERLPVYATGLFPLGISQNTRDGTDEDAHEGPDEAEERDIPAMLAQYLAKAADYALLLDSVEGGRLAVRGIGEGRLHVDLLADGLDFGEGRAEQLEARVIAFTNRPSGFFRVRAEKLEAMGAMSGGLQVEGALRFDSLGNLSGSNARALAYASWAEWRGERAEGIFFKGSNYPVNRGAEAVLRLGGLPAKLHLHSDAAGDPVLDYDIVTELGPWLRLAKVPEEEVAKRLTIARPLQIQGRVRRDAEGEFNADFELYGWDFDCRGTPIDFFYAYGNADKERIVCDDVVLTGGPSYQRGTFRQDLKTADWDLRLIGDIYPPVLGGLLGHWWDDIWTDFVFDGPPVRADLRLSGCWKKLGHVDIWGRVWLEHLQYQKIRLEEGTLILQVSKNFVDLYDIDAQSDNGSVGGRLAWILEPDEPMFITLNMRSTLPLEGVNKIFGSALKDQLPDWELPVNPNLTMRGNIRHLREGGWQSEIEAIALIRSGKWRGIGFDLVSADVVYKHGDVHIFIPFAELMNGSLKAKVGLAGGGDSSRMDIELNLLQTDFGPSIDALHLLADRDKGEASEHKSGKLDLDFKGSALVGNVTGTLSGDGAFKVKGAELGKIKAFWLLSSLLDGVGLGIGSFSMDSIDADFSIGAGIVNFSRAEVGGPAVRVETKGKMDLIGGGLDFDAKVFMLQTTKPSLINLLGAILSPVGYILELRLGGTLEEPSWRFKIDPRNLFSSGHSEKGSG